MKKNLIICAMTLSAIVIVGGCVNSNSTKNNETDGTTQAVTEASSVAENTAPVKPENYGEVVKLGNYKGVDITIEDTTVTDEEVQAEIDNEMANNPTTIQVMDRAAVSGDTVNIDYEGKTDGVAFDGGTAQGYDLTLGSGSFIDGFEDQLVGAKPGDTVEVNVTFPENYQSTDLAGKPAVFTVKVNYINETKPVTELSDEWIEKITNSAATDEASYRALVKASLEDNKKKNSEYQGQYAALTAVVENSEINPNQEAIDYEYNMQVNSYQNTATQYGMDMAALASAYNFASEEDFLSELKTYAEEGVKQQLVISAIYDAEKMELTEEDYTRIADMYNSTKDDLVTNYGQEPVDQEAKTYKVVYFVYDNANKSIADTTEASMEEETTVEAQEKTTTEEQLQEEITETQEETTTETQEETTTEAQEETTTEAQ